MASPTPNKGYTYPAHGGAVNAWDSPLNADFDQIDLNVGGYYPITIGSSIGAATFNSSGATIPSTAASITLPSSLAQNQNYTLNGTLTNAMSLVFPSAGSNYNVTNNSSGAFAITAVAASSGQTAVIGQGGSNSLYCDGANIKLSNTNAGRFTSVLGNPNGTLAGYASPITGAFSDVAWDATNRLLYVCTTTGSSATAVWSMPTATVARGFDTAINLEISATHTGGNLLQVALKTAAGADPTPADPIICEFQTLSGANTTGATTSVSITAALSMTTNAVGASMGSTNNVPFRIWLALFNNAGTAVLGMRNCSAGGSVYGISEYGVASTISISAAATSAGVWYTPNGTTLANCAYRVIGYIEYTGGLATAGTYTSDPTNAVVFGPGVKLPGEIIQAILNSSTTAATTASTVFVVLTNGITQAITPTSAINQIKISIDGTIQLTGGVLSTVQLARGATLIGIPYNYTNIAGDPSPVLAHMFWIDNPNTVSTTTYGFQGKLASGGTTLSYPPASTGITIYLEEIMG